MIQSIKRKSVLFNIFAVLLLIFLTACGSKTVGDSAGQDDKDQLKAAFITAQKVGDNGPVDMAYSGLKKGTEEFGIKGQLIEVEKGEYEESMRAMAQDGYKLIIALFPELLDAVKRVAPEFPETKFVMILGQVDEPNVRSIFQNEQEGAFLSGVLAASMTTTNKIGFIGGNDNPQINRWLAGYQAGAKEVNPNVEVVNSYVGDFENPTKGKELALTQYKNGVDIIFHAAAKSGLGVLDAAKDTGNYAIGGSADQNDTVPGQVLGSAVEFYNNMVYDALKDLKEGNPIGGEMEFGGLKEERIDLVLAPDNLVDIPDDLKEKINDYRQKIINGEIEVPDKPIR